MTTRTTRTSSASADEIFNEIGAFLVGGGLITMVLFPFALPILVLVVVPLIAVGLVVAVAGAIAVAPLLLFRLVRSLLGRARRASRPMLVPDPGPLYRDRAA